MTSALAWGSAAAAQQPAPAQTAQAEAEPQEDLEIVVTGSFIRGAREDAAMPIDVFTADDLNQQGVSTPLEFIKQLPSVGATLGDSNQYSTASQGFQGNGSLNLRGLGPERTLVLFNGRRTVLAPGDGFIDTNLIPVFALQNIEVLKDGAAATYGSDAIAGVANFTTRSNLNGVIIQGDFDAIKGSRGNWTGSILAGKQFGRLNLMAGFGWQHRSTLANFSRAFSRTPFAVNPSGWSALSTPGLFNVRRQDGTSVTARDGGNAGCAAVGGVNDGTLCRFSFIPWNNIIEEEDRYQAYAQADWEVSDRTKVRLEFLYAQTDLNSLGYSPSFPPTQGPRGSGSANAFSVAPNNPGVAPFLSQTGLAANDPANPITAVTAVFWRPFGWLGNPADPDRGTGRGRANNKAYRFSGGIEHEFADNFRGQFYATWWRSDRRTAVPDMIGSRLQAALNGLGGPNCTGTTPGANGCQWFNPFINAAQPISIQGLTNPNFVPGASNSVDLVNWVHVKNGTYQVEEQTVLDAIFSGETGIDLGGGPIAYAFGAQYRGNRWNSAPINPESDLNVNPCFVLGDRSCVGTPIEGVGSFIFLGGTRAERVTQEVKAVFAEVKIPVSTRLEVTAAARFEDYGGAVGSTFNPKGTVRWNATDWLILRGSVGTTFRGPRANQVARNQITSLAGIQAAANNFKSVDIFGNPNDLGPETAFTYNVGAVVKTGGFSVSADYWSFDVNDRIATTPAQAIATSVASGAVAANGTRFANCSSVLANLITFQGGCVQGTTTGFDISRVRTDWVNGPGIKVSGLDLSIDYKTGMLGGQLSVGAQGSFILNFKFEDFVFRGVLLQSGYQARGFTNYFRDPLTVSPFRANAWVNYNIDGFNARYQLRYVDGVRDDRCIGLTNCASTSFGPTNFGATVNAFTQHDIHFQYDLPFEGVKTQLQFSVENFTNADPPGSRLEPSYDPFIGNPLGRVFRFGARVQF
ncbi:MAG: TonB-dependent receptor [Alphaproteobacteria bacterium]|nr:TonB-dependent receptor [Alphaproteobacteria bacterium]